MGAIASCCRTCFGGDKEGGDNYETIGGTTTPTDPEERRRQLAEAAERRREADAHRGVKDPEAVRRMKERTEKREQLEEEMERRGQRADEPGLTWTVK